jgi:hypothetical protein
MTTGGILFYRSRWLADIKERIAVDGVKSARSRLVQKRTDFQRKKISQRNRSKKSAAG